MGPYKVMRGVQEVLSWPLAYAAVSSGYWVASLLIYPPPTCGQRWVGSVGREDRCSPLASWKQSDSGLLAMKMQQIQWFFPVLY